MCRRKGRLILVVLGSLIYDLYIEFVVLLDRTGRRVEVFRGAPFATHVVHLDLVSIGHHLSQPRYHVGLNLFKRAIQAGSLTCWQSILVLVRRDVIRYFHFYVYQN